MLARKILTCLTVVVGLAISVHGCYTIIKHPSMNVENSESSDEESTSSGSGYTHSNYDHDCMRCHTDYEQYPYGYYYNYYPDYYWSEPRWGDYYTYPWWWNGYWYDGGYSSSNKLPADTVDQINRPDRRRGIPPPYTRDVTPLPPPTFTPTPTTTTPSTGGTTTGGSTTNPSNNNNDDDKKEDQKPPRRRGK